MKVPVIVGLGFVGAIAICRALGMSPGSDPVLPGEIAAAAMLAIWSLILGHDLWTGHRLGRELSRISRRADADGVPYWIVDGGVLACVVGGFRPRTYLGSELVGRLDPEELEAILLHEDHHRQTRAPLRGAALRAWARLLGRSARVSRIFEAREAQLEREADRYAIDRGVSRGAIARALLKCQPTAFGTGFADHREARIRALINGESSDDPPSRRFSVPYEWVPIVTTVVIWVGCHLP